MEKVYAYKSVAVEVQKWFLMEMGEVKRLVRVQGGWALW